MILVVENHFKKGILDGWYLNVLKAAMKYVTDKDYEIEIYVEEEVQFRE